jgi:hypothetical protein
VNQFSYLDNVSEHRTVIPDGNIQNAGNTPILGLSHFLNTPRSPPHIEAVCWEKANA